MPEPAEKTAQLIGMVNLADARLGAEVVHATDEFFAPKERLLNPDEPISRPDTFDGKGQWMDGWETRRRRREGHDFCIIKLARPGVIEQIDIDTRHFTGNFAPQCSIDATASGDPANAATKWTSILPVSRLRGDDHNFFSIESDVAWQNLRLNIFPDGGIARLRVYCDEEKEPARLDEAVLISGENDHHWSGIADEEIIDLFAKECGGQALECNDQHFGDIERLNGPGRGKNMGDGWETRRRREPGFDWVIVKLGHPGIIKEVEIDTAHFRGNSPAGVSLNAALVHQPAGGSLAASSLNWPELMPRQPVEPDTQNRFSVELLDIGTVTHVRVNLHPDGGLSRVRLRGTISRA